MSRIDELISKFCPKGIPFYSLGELGKFYGGITGKSKDDFIDGTAKFITYRNVYSNSALNLNLEDRVKIEHGEKQRTLQRSLQQGRNSMNSTEISYCLSTHLKMEHPVS